MGLISCQENIKFLATDTFLQSPITGETIL